MGKSLTLLWFSGIFEKVVLSLALTLGLYFVRLYDHFIRRQWLEELIYLEVIYILPFFVLFVCCVLGCCSDFASQSLCHAISPELFLVWMIQQKHYLEVLFFKWS